MEASGSARPRGNSLVVNQQYCDRAHGLSVQDLLLEAAPPSLQHDDDRLRIRPLVHASRIDRSAPVPAAEGSVHYPAGDDLPVIRDAELSRRHSKPFDHDRAYKYLERYVRGHGIVLVRERPVVIAGLVMNPVLTI